MLIQCIQYPHNYSKKFLVAFIDYENLNNTNIYFKHVHTEPIPLFFHVKEHLIKIINKNTNKIMETHFISRCPKGYVTKYWLKEVD